MSTKTTSCRQDEITFRQKNNHMSTKYIVSTKKGYLAKRLIWRHPDNVDRRQRRTANISLTKLVEKNVEKSRKLTLVEKNC